MGALQVILALSTRPLDATQVRLVNLETMTERADRIFSGRVLSVRMVRDDEAGQTVTLVHLKVERAVKGSLGSTTTIKLLGDRSRKDSTDWIGLPSFQEGEEVVLFLYRDSRLGLTSPVGLSQGKFGVQTDKQGRRRAINAVGNRGLHSNLSADAAQRLGLDVSSPPPPRAIDPEELLDCVERLKK